MAVIYRDPKFNSLYERLCDKPTQYTKRSIFRTNLELTVLAAMIGFSKRRRVPLSEKSNEIPQRIFQNQNYDGLVYLVAVLDRQSGEMFREKNELEAWKIFEEYANGGLTVISEVFADNPNDFDGVSSLLSFIKEAAIEATISTSNGDEVVF